MGILEKYRIPMLQIKSLVIVVPERIIGIELCEYDI